MITVPQIKAARGLLDWTQRDLAKISGISPASIAQIERGAGNPRAETMKTLQQAFEKYDVEFSDDPGLRIRQEPFAVNVWRGRDGILNVWKDIENVFADGTGGEVLLSSLDDSLWKKFWRKELPEAIAKRKVLKVKTRALIKKREDNRGLPNDWCRIVPKAMPAEAPFYVYKDKVAIIKLIDPIRVILITNPTLADSFRAQFEYHWDNGRRV
jgi:transcriptional regulator with XRE-family HTH domain